MTPAAFIVAIAALNLLCGAVGIGLGVFLVKRSHRRETVSRSRRVLVIGKCRGCGMPGAVRDCCEDRPAYCTHCYFIHEGLDHDTMPSGELVDGLGEAG